MTDESFFSHPKLEGFNLVLDRSVDRDEVLATARELVANRIGVPDDDWVVAPVGPVDHDVDHDVDLDPATSPEFDLVVAQPRLDVLLAGGRAPDIGVAWETTYELMDLPGVAAAEPLWLLTQDDFVDPPTSSAEASELRRLVPTTSSAPAVRARRGVGAEPTDASWSPKMLQAPQAWAVEPPTPEGRSRGESIRVGHPDSGYLTHAELTSPGEPSDRFLEQLGHDFVDGDRLENEDGTHGTGTASVLMSWDGPDPVPSPTVLGVAPAAEIVPYRVSRRHSFVPSPVLFWSGARRLRDAIYLATRDGCHVISISLGWWKSGSLHRAVQHAVDNDVIVVAAAGNYVRKVVWPAAYPEVVAVAGCTHDRRTWWGSSRGGDIDITGPAADVYRAAFVDGTQRIEPGDGTSYAAASVAGIAALWLAHHDRDRLLDHYRGKRTLADVFAEALATTADPAPSGHEGKFGAGIANARRLLRSPLPDPDGAGPTVRRRAAPRAPTELAAIEAELDISDRPGRVRLARSIGVRPRDLPIDLGGMTDELLFHIMTDPQRRELAFGADRLRPGEAEDGLVRTSEPAGTAPVTRSSRSTGTVAPPRMSDRLADRLGTGPAPAPGQGVDAERDGPRPERVIDVADDEFVLVGPDWTVGWTLDQLERTGTLAAIVTRSLGPSTTYHLLHRRQLESLDPDRTVDDGVDLRPSEASPTIEADAPLDRAERIDRPTVVVHAGSVVGFLVPVHEMAAAGPPPRATRPSHVRQPPRRRSGSAGDEGTAADTVTRRLEAELPNRASVDEEVGIVVSLSAEGVGADAGADLVAGRIGDTVDLILSTRSGVELAGPHQHHLTITAGGSPQYCHFKVRAVVAGPASMQLLAFIDGRSVAVIPLALEVVDAPADEPEQPLRAVAELEPPQYEDPDLTLLIYEQVLPGQGSSLQFTLTGRDPDLELNFEPFGHVGFRDEPDEYFDEYFGDIEELLPPTHFPADIVDAKVRAMGAKLYDDIVPAELRDQLWAIRDRVESILIQSTDPWVPWEMCFLTGPDENGTVVEHGFVCERYDVSRWIQAVPLRVDLALDRLALVVTGDSGLPSAQAEAATVRCLQRLGVQVDDIPASYDGVYQALVSGSYTGFHFTGHGLYPQGIDPNRSQIELEGGIPFRAGDIGGVVKNLGQSTPLVVLNACQAGRGGMGLVGAGGWATALLNAGAGAFIGAHWSVLDDPAARFSEVLYDRLLAGDTLPAAVRKARLDIRAPGDPTWLAYVLYAVCGVRVSVPSES